MMRIYEIVGLCMAFAVVCGCGDDVNVGEESDDGGGGGSGAGSGGNANGSSEICTCLEDCGTCPDAESVAITDYDFSVDRTEVTNAQYAAFVAADAAPQATWSDPGLCDWNETYVPRKDWPFDAGRDNHPVVWVDRCDALAFCEWAGKHLCGKVGEGPEGRVVDWNSPTQSEWYNTCAESSSETATYPYGFPYDGSTCNGREYGVDDTVPVASAPNCHGQTQPYDAVFDMSGNVAEWGERLKGDGVTVRGGSYLNNFTDLACGTPNLVFNASELDSRGDLGFRCCGDLPN